MAWKFPWLSTCTSLDKYYWNVGFQCGCAAATARALPQVAETLWVWCCIPDPVAGVGQKPVLKPWNLWAVSLSQLPSWQTGQFPSCSTSHPCRRRTWPKKSPRTLHIFPYPRSARICIVSSAGICESLDWSKGFVYRMPLYLMEKKHGFRFPLNCLKPIIPLIERCRKVLDLVHVSAVLRMCPFLSASANSVVASTSSHRADLPWFSCEHWEFPLDMFDYESASLWIVCG